MKILFAANRLPYPPFRGDKLKIYHLAKRLSKKYDLQLLTFLQDKSDLQYLPELEKIFKKIHLVRLSKWKSYFNIIKGIGNTLPFQVNYFVSKSMAEAIDNLLLQEKFDLVHVQHLRMAQFWSKRNNIPRILDLPDAYSLYWQRRVQAHKGLNRWLNEIEYRRVLKYEGILNKFDKTLVCSEEDKVYLENIHNVKNISLLPNGVDMEVFGKDEHQYSIDSNILFTGNMDYAPNIDAVCYFVQDILPIIHRAFPNVEFIIAGQRPVKKVLALASDKVRVTGFVENLSHVYAQASIVVAPLRFGAGTQNKVLEAMAMGIPVVSRNIGFKGLNVKQGDGVFLAMESQCFADTCINLLNSMNLRRQTGLKGKKIVSEQFDWKVISKKMELHFKNTIVNP